MHWLRYICCILSVCARVIFRIKKTLHTKTDSEHSILWINGKSFVNMNILWKQMLKIRGKTCTQVLIIMIGNGRLLYYYHRSHSINSVDKKIFQMFAVCHQTNPKKNLNIRRRSFFHDLLCCP